MERWTSQVALESHFQQPHMVEILARVPELLEGAPVITPYEPLPAGDPAKGSF